MRITVGTFTSSMTTGFSKLKSPQKTHEPDNSLRHWKATMEHHKTKDILHIKQMREHKNINNTLLYTQLVTFEIENTLQELPKRLKKHADLLRWGLNISAPSSKPKSLENASKVGY